MELTCKCPSCAASEEAKKNSSLPYRYVPGRGQNIFHLALNFSLPLVGVILIGFSWWALAPVIGFIAVYLLNSFLFCAACPYHHENVKLCGCFPKSVFPFKRYKKWGHADNIVAWLVNLSLLMGASLAVLVAQGDLISAYIFLSYAAFGLLLHGIISCPNCRQRSVCYLGRAVMNFKR